MVQLHHGYRKRSREVSTSSTGYVLAGAQGSLLTPTEYKSNIITQSKQMLDAETLFPFVKGMQRKGGIFAQGMTGISMYDLGCNMHSEEISRHTNLHVKNWKLENIPVGGPLQYTVVHSGPVYLGGALGNIVRYTDQDWSDKVQLAFGEGGTAIARARPNKPEVDLSVTIGELRSEGLPSMIGSVFSRSRTVFEAFRNGGKEYLNLQFGWKPLEQDIQALAQMVLTARSKIEQYERDLRREIRRRYTFPEQITTSAVSKLISQDTGFWIDPGSPLGGANPNVLTYNSASRDNGTYVKRESQRTWFSGAFRYFNADVENSMQDLLKFEEHANLLLGTRLDPEVLWNLQPWSWLVDWFVNYGDVLGNISAFAFDRQVMHYGYLMKEWDVYEEWSVPTMWAKTGFFNSSSRNLGIGVSSSRTTKRKLRVNAFPFGFGLDPSTFTVEQWAILASLGITRVK